MQTTYEKEKNLVERKSLSENILDMMDELNDPDFHSIYNLIWSLSAKDLLLRLNDSEKKREARK